MNISTKFSTKHIIAYAVYPISLFSLIFFGTLDAEAKKKREIADSEVPIDVISADEYNTWNVADLSELLRTLPGTTTRSNAGLAAASTANINLRNLGTLSSNPASTLVLVDGRRVPAIPADLPSIDLQRI